MQTTIQHNINLRSLNTFGIPVSSRFFTVIKQIDELQTLLRADTFRDVPKLVLGGGSNILFTQDFAGLTIKNEIAGIECVAETDDHVLLRVGAGENWHELVLHCIEQGYAGIENLSLIPGTVGAAPIQNIGAYGVELSDVFCELTAVDVMSGEVKTFQHEQCRFGYRESVFKSIYKNQYVIATVTLRLQKKPQFNLSYGALQTTLDEMNVKELTLKAVSQAVMHIRRSKLPDPKEIGNAGSFFKNPVISSEQFAALQKQFANIPHFPTATTDAVKISAGWLIEQCGWKGKRLGEVGVHDKQALVIVNYGAGTGAAVQDLVQKIQQSVRERFGVQLTPEVNIL